ncbi:MAG: molybdate ABC transporter substrate-binding protein [Proteobacteria bacterium]|nr:molybdate ABC transporter substrate-binding protein [Pseudomonadota bacterium]
MKKAVIHLLVAFAFISAATVLPARAEDEVLVFAAASTTNAITEVCRIFNRKGQGTAKASFASSSTLAKQIENGAPARVYISANVKWMDYLQERGLIETRTRRDLWGNRVVLIAPADSDTPRMDVGPDLPLTGLLHGGRLAMGDPDHVPAGIYAKQALVSLGLWERVEPHLARAKDVRAALALVERGECPLGLVYATDAAISKKVRVIGLVPESAHPPIIYPAAILEGQARGAVSAFFELLRSPESRTVFEKYGFTVR